MNNRFLYQGWTVSKNGNIYKLIDGDIYTIGHYGNKYSVFTDGHKINGIYSLREAKEIVYRLAYGDSEVYYSSGDSSSDKEYFENPMFKEIVKLGYRQLSKKYHPDMEGGNAEKMKILNQLYDELKEKL